MTWTLVSPQTVMETNLFGQIEGIRQARSMYGSAGDGRIGMVALDDGAEVAAHALQSEPKAWSERNLEITGPAALTYAEIAAELSKGFGCEISYVDMLEDDFATMLIENGVPAVDLDLLILCHFRQMRAGIEIRGPMTNESPTRICLKVEELQQHPGVRIQSAELSPLALANSEILRPDDCTLIHLTRSSATHVVTTMMHL